jgi:uncharacterized protein (TIGR00297 family)
MPALSAFNENPVRLLLALVLAGLISTASWRVRALTTDGAIAATAIGALIVAGGGWWCGALLILFFGTSTFLSKYRKSRTTDIRQERGSQRDAVQVAANGAIPTLFAVLAGLTGSDVLLIGAITAIATATADTWATEIGRLTQAPPRSITTGKRVPVGTSGAISVPGTIATVLGSILIGGGASLGVANGWLESDHGAWLVLLIVAIAGVAGSVLDSLLGATLQESFTCPICKITTESVEHIPGHRSVHAGGLRGFNNDAVNVSSVLMAALATIAWLVTLD